MTRLFIAVVLLFGVQSLLAGDVPASSLKLYTLHHGNAEATEQTLRELYGRSAGVSISRQENRVVVLAPDRVHRQIEDLVKQLDVRPRNVQIQVRFDEAGSQHDRGASVRTRGEVSVGGSGTHGALSIDPRLHHRSGSTRRNALQTLTVMSGRSARLQVGQQVPQLAWLMDYGRREGWVSGVIAWERVGASLAIQPQVLGDGPMIRVRVVPELSGLVDGQPRSLHFASAATEVTVRDGETIRIGGLSQHRDFYRHFLVGAESGATHSTLEISLTPRLLP